MHKKGCPCWDCGYPGMKARFPRDPNTLVLLDDGTWVPVAPVYYPSLVERLCRLVRRT